MVSSSEILVRVEVGGGGGVGLGAANVGKICIDF